MLKKRKIESSRTSSKRVQKIQFCIAFKPVNPGDCEGVVQFIAVTIGISIMQRAVADRFLCVSVVVDIIRRRASLQLR